MALCVVQARRLDVRAIERRIDRACVAGGDRRILVDDFDEHAQHLARESRRDQSIDVVNGLETGLDADATIQQRPHHVGLHAVEEVAARGTVW